MPYAIYKKSNRIVKIVGNPRSPENQKGLVVWDNTKRGVESWRDKWIYHKKVRVIKKRVKRVVKRRAPSGLRFGFNPNAFFR